MITDTEAIAHALDLAAQAWPEVPRGGAAITRLVRLAADVLESDHQVRVRAVESLTEFGGVYPPGYLDEVREGWPQ